MFTNADIIYDNLKHPNIFWEWRIQLDNEFQFWAIAMLKIISKWEGWEESEQVYYREFMKMYDEKYKKIYY